HRLGDPLEPDKADLRVDVTLRIAVRGRGYARSADDVAVREEQLRGRPVLLLGVARDKEGRQAGDNGEANDDGPAPARDVGHLPQSLADGRNRVLSHGPMRR